MSIEVRQYVLATRNAHKVEEVRAILASCGVSIELVALDAFPDAPEVIEDGLTFEENALKKARAATAATGLPAIADDSGLCVEALNGMPGIFSARWSGRHGDDAANLELLLGQLAEVPDVRRGAHFACAAALVGPSGAEHVVVGRLAGTLIRAPRGSGGFGYDPIFVPDGFDRTTAELSATEKNAISHRGMAMQELSALMNSAF